MRPGPRLAVVLGLLTVAAGAVHLTPPVPECPHPAPLQELPAALAGWTGAGSVPDEVLPVDASAAAETRRTYRNSRRVAWVSVALFTRQDEPERRAAVNRIYPEQGVSLVERVDLPPVMAVLVSEADRRLVVAYWHQLGRHVYASELAFRWALVQELLLARRGDSLLVRVAVPVGPAGVPSSLTTAAELTRALLAALAGRGGC